MGKTGFSLLLAMGLVTLSTSSEKKCILSGAWQNELGSNMTIFAVNKAGQFSGLYLTAVSAAKKPILVSPINGSQHIDSLEQPTFGFTVKWTFSDSTTVFVGQCFVDDHGEETLQTMWLLREKAKSAENNWNATMVGTNIFTRIKGQKVSESMRNDL
ncbi:avidin-like isoform X1 [Gopherus flavomarginatus]|uniref:avidin-like isoform X1 n=1 Tax=Gopherus flavomarginatus TaxID=286002 RepID=UPI0021CBFDCC|nr:avidin-like isoform X1 [Gopherus flavomarginatus]